MCLNLPARVISVDGDWAEVEIDGARHMVSTLAAPEVRPGDWALLAAGTLVRRLQPEVAAEIRAALGAPMTEDVAARQGADR